MSKHILVDGTTTSFQLILSVNSLPCAWTGGAPPARWVARSTGATRSTAVKDRVGRGRVGSDMARPGQSVACTDSQSQPRDLSGEQNRTARRAIVELVPFAGRTHVARYVINHLSDFISSLYGCRRPGRESLDGRRDTTGRDRHGLRR